MSRMMLLWHPESPGSRVWALVPWWRVRYARKWGFATLTDAIRWAGREDAIVALLPAIPTTEGETP